MRKLLSSICVGVLLLSGCDTTNFESIDEPENNQPIAIPEDWISIEPDSIFLFKAPPDLVDQEITGIDSFIGLYRGERIVVGFDYGPYYVPNAECWDGYLECRLERALIDGMVARVFSSKMVSQDQSLGSILYQVTVELEESFDGYNYLFFNAGSYTPEDTTSLRLIAQSIDFVP